MNFSTRFLEKISHTNWWVGTRVVDIIDEPVEMKRLFDLASTDTQHRNYKNFLNLHDRYQHYTHFHVVYKNDEPLAFSGMFTHSSYKDFIRICDRTYYFPQYRSNSLQRPKIDAASRFFLPIQHKIAYEENYKPFTSIQESNRRQSLKVTLDHVNKLNNLNFVLLDGLRFVGLKKINDNVKLWHTVACDKRDSQELSEFLLKMK
tara:strand:- start:1166 stop:1777 length:612 start_codon:yes stop_codon:yes gene_type:complete